MTKQSPFFIETRSTTGISKKSKEETFYKSGISKPHYRMLYSLDYLSSLLTKYFKIEYIEESDKFAPFLKNKSFVIRAIIKKNQKSILQVMTSNILTLKFPIPSSIGFEKNSSLFSSS